MKTTAALVLISALSASAFVPVHKPRFAQPALDAKSKEEDLELTRKVIADFFGESDDAPAPAPAAAPAEEDAPKSEKKGKKSKK